MSLHAVDALPDAVEATKRFLLPPSPGRWLRLAVVVFFVGGFGAGLPNGSGSTTVDGTPPTDRSELLATPLGDLVGAVPTGDVVATAAVAAVGLAVYLGFRFVGAVMEFVLVASLRADAVRLRRDVGRYWRQGARLFGFRVATSLVVLGVVAGVFALAGTSLVDGGVPTWTLRDLLAVVAAVLPALAVAFALEALLQGFTTAFVVPVMLAEGRSVLDGWRRFWPTLRGHPRQYGAYLLVAFVLTLALGVAAGLVVILVTVLLVVPVALVALAVVALGVLPSTAGTAAVVGLGLLFALLVLSVVVVQVPLRTFMRYYTLFVLGDTNEAFDVIPETRRAVRA